MKSRLYIPLLAFGLLFPSVAPVAAQVEISIYPRAGLLAPDGYFYEIFQDFISAEETQWTTASLGRAGIFGLGADLTLMGGNLHVRAEVMQVFDGWLTASHSIILPPNLQRPPKLVTTWMDIPYDLTVTTVQIVLPTRLEVWRIEPYFAGGIGGKIYRFGDPTREYDPNATLPQDGFTWAVDVGAGLTAPITESLTIDLQARDAISKYWDKTQNDFIFSAAILWQVY